jgi:chromosome segregation ATPase
MPLSVQAATLRATASELRLDLSDKVEAIERLEGALEASEHARARIARELSEAKVALTTLEEAAETHEAVLGETCDVLHASQTHGARLAEMLEAAAVARSEADRRLAVLAAERDAARGEATEQAHRANQLDHALQVAQASATADMTLREHLTNELQRERLASAQAQTAARQSAEALVASEATATGYMEEIARLHALLQPPASTAPPQAKRGPAPRPRKGAS